MAKKKNSSLPPQNDLETSNSSGDNIVNAIWNFFSSMKVGISLLAIVAVMSIIGTVWTQLYEESPTGKFYNAWYFKIFLVLLLINLLVCSINRLKQITTTLKGPKAKISESTIDNLKLHTSFKAKGTMQSVGNKVAEVLKRRGYRVFTDQGTDKLYYGSDKGSYSILGPYMTHISFMIIIIALWISFTPSLGYQGFVFGKVGSTINTQRDVQSERGQIKENFDIKVKGFDIITRPDGSVDRYQSDLAVIDNGKEMLNKRIIVNDPLRYKGYSFYQSSYKFGMTGKVNSQPFEVELNQNTNIPIQGTDFVIVPTGYEGNKVGYAIYQGQNQQPVKQDVTDFGKLVTYQNATFQIDSIDKYTGLQVVKDPGKPIVFVGSILLMLGMLISFLMRNRKIWVIVSEKNGTISVNLGGLTQKNKPAFEKEFESLAEDLKEDVKSERGE